MNRNNNKKKKSWSKKMLRILLVFIISVFLLLNIFAAIQAYSTTHFNPDVAPAQTLDSVKQASTGELLKTLVFGVDIPKPRTSKVPTHAYQSLRIPVSEGKELAAWIMRPDSVTSKGLIILCHGYTDEKSFLLDYAYELLNMGYSTLLFDFMGAGESYGVQSTIGYKEAENVKTVYDYATNTLGEKRIFLMGFSMGAAAIIKAQHDHQLPIAGIVAEAAYGTMYDTMRVRLGGKNVFSSTLTVVYSFWGSVLNGINAFAMNPEEYVKTIEVPIIIGCGDEDQYIPVEETERIYNNVASKQKQLVIYKGTRHVPYIGEHREQWILLIREFLEKNS